MVWKRPPSPDCLSIFHIHPKSPTPLAPLNETFLSICWTPWTHGVRGVGGVKGLPGPYANCSNAKIIYGVLLNQAWLERDCQLPRRREERRSKNYKKSLWNTGRGLGGRLQSWSGSGNAAALFYTPCLFPALTFQVFNHIINAPLKTTNIPLGFVSSRLVSSRYWVSDFDTIFWKILIFGTISDTSS